VFKLTAPSKGGILWTETVLHRFAGGPGDGSQPLAGLVFDDSGALYGTTSAGGVSEAGVVFKLTPPAPGRTGWVETVLYDFKGAPGDGSQPFGALLFDGSGALYGTTVGGGTRGSGVVFKLTPPVGGGVGWTETVLYNFCSHPNCSDGADPFAGLVADGLGNLYGTTRGGGASGFGTVFRLTPPGRGRTAWTETVLHNFGGGSSGDQNPNAGLVAATGGALFGTTSGGSAGPNCTPTPTSACGTVFRLTPPTHGGNVWTESILHSFEGGTDGAVPLAGLILDKRGALYGTTEGEGINPDCFQGCGTVFKLAPPARGHSAWSEAVFHRFTRTSGDGAFPGSALIADTNGVLYGTTSGGGRRECRNRSGVSECGTVFEVTQTGFAP
jgi:uncharacterized repeat protein (TIGR03803 family)